MEEGESGPRRRSTRGWAVFEIKVSLSTQVIRSTERKEALPLRPRKTTKTEKEGPPDTISRKRGYESPFGVRQHS